MCGNFDLSVSLKIIFLADTHLGFDYPLRPRLDIRRRGPDFFDNFHRICQTALEEQADLLVHGGDVFFRSKVPPKIVDMVYQPLLKVAAQGIPVVLVPGNHERSRLPESLFLAQPNIHIFDRPLCFRFSIRGITINLAGFPFFRGDIRRQFPRIIAETGWRHSPGDVSLLCLHQAVEGATVGPQNFTFRYGEDVIRLQDIPADFRMILAGHIHRQQILRTARQQPVIYPGSIERTAFAEINEEKGFYLIEIWQENSKIAYRLHFRPLPTRPMVIVEIAAESVRPENISEILAAKLNQLDPNSVVQLRFSGDINPTVGRMLTADFLRAHYPPTMNVHWSGYRDPFLD